MVLFPISQESYNFVFYLCAIAPNVFLLRERDFASHALSASLTICQSEHCHYKRNSYLIDYVYNPCPAYDGFNRLTVTPEAVCVQVNQNRGHPESIMVICHQSVAFANISLQ